MNPLLALRPAPAAPRLLSAVLMAALAIGSLPDRAPAATVTLKPGKDTTIYGNGNASLSSGAGLFLLVGSSGQQRTLRSLVAFNFAGQIPVGATINSVNVAFAISSPQATHVTTVRLHRALAEWGEGTSVAGSGGGGGAPATVGDATWNARIFNTANWTTPGGDFAPEASASQVVSGSTGTATFTSAGLVADVQAWVNNPATNFGWIMVAQNEASPAVRFASREGVVAPSLLVDFTAPTSGGATPPAVTTQPASQLAATGAAVTLTVAASGTPTFQWRQNGTAIAGATSASLTISNVQPANAGLYSTVLTNASGSASSNAVILGVTSNVKLVGSGQEFPDIVGPPPNLFVYDQILLGGAAATVKADANQILRISFIDLNDDIVQVEYSGAGTLTLVLEGATGPAAPKNYNQATTYIKGHAGIVLTGADATTNLSVFSVGRANAANQGLFRAEVTYDGFADIAFIAITSADGKFGGLRAANTSCFATKGFTGVYAPGVQFTGPVFVSDINASDEATPVYIIGSSSINDVRVTGGDLLQTNGRAVQVSGITQLKFTAGSNSHGTLFNALNNKGRLEQNGTDVTAQIVVNPTP